MRWWQDESGGAKHEEWAVVVGEDGNVGVHGDVTGCRNGDGMLHYCWNFSWDECGVLYASNRKNRSYESSILLCFDNLHKFAQVCANLHKIHLHKYESFFKFMIFLSGDADLNPDLNTNLNPRIFSNLSVMSQKGESQNGCFKKTKHAKFSEKQTFLTSWYAHVRLSFALLTTSSDKHDLNWS